MPDKFGLYVLRRLLLHPHSRENGASEMMETWRYPWVGDEVGWPSDNFQPPGDRREKNKSRIFHRKIWRLKKSLFCSRNRETIVRESP